jgi:pimeloyl-ACP methyl ester carboxylesterase
MKRNLFLILVALTFVGCVGHDQYTTAPELFNADAVRDGYRKSIRSCGTVAHAERDVDPEVDELCDLAIIEFDDQGEFWQRKQLDATLRLIHERSRPDQEALVILFVHGWQNDASPRNERRGNLASFNEVLLDIAAEQVEQCKEEIARLCGRPVVGVYLAWRGDTFRTPLGKSISYFHRRATAERVARVSFSHALHRIVNHAKGVRVKGEDGKPVVWGTRESVVLVVGHSLGALILENTILRSLTHETDDFRESFPVDMAVLVNSANDSVISRQFVDSLQGAPPAPDAQGRWSLPLIVSVTSRGDWATRRLTPASQTVRRVGKTFRNYPSSDDGRPIPRHSRQLFFFKRTAAHTGPGAGLLSHEISCPGVEGGCAGISRSKRLSLAELRGEEKPDRKLFDRPAIEPWWG